jgi:hypothetical protein
LERVEVALLPAKLNIKSKARIVMERPHWGDTPGGKGGRRVGQMNLAESFCTRWLQKNGALFEYVSLRGSKEQLSDDELENWIATFPIRRQVRQVIQRAKSADVGR